MHSVLGCCQVTCTYLIREEHVCKIPANAHTSISCSHTSDARTKNTIYIYIYMHTYIHKYIHTYTSSCWVSKFLTNRHAKEGKRNKKKPKIASMKRTPANKRSQKVRACVRVCLCVCMCGPYRQKPRGNMMSNEQNLKAAVCLVSLQFWGSKHDSQSRCDGMTLSQLWWHDS